jgi:hypothetical protein
VCGTGPKTEQIKPAVAGQTSEHVRPKMPVPDQTISSDQGGNLIRPIPKLP